MRRLFHALLLLGAGTLFFGCDAESKMTPNGGGSTQTGATQDDGKNDSQTSDSTQGTEQSGQQTSQTGTTQGNGNNDSQTGDSTQGTEQSGQQTGTTQDNENNDSQTDDSTQGNQSQGNQPTTTTIWSGTKDFSSWDVNIQISAENFSSFEAGSKIQIEWHEPATAAEYKKLQLDYMASTWEELKGGEFSGGKTDDTAGVIPETSPLTYTVTADNAQKLKSHGLALMGYGVVVTKIAISAGSSSSENPPATPNQPPATQTGTPFEKHGKLHVSGAYLYDKHNEKYQLYGMSTHGISFEGYAYGNYLNDAAMTSLRDDWNTNCIRIVLYPRDHNGYLNGGDKAKLKSIVKNGIESATKAGMYALVDWHVHDYNPQDTQTEAIAFLTEIAGEYAEYDNVLYEICNEPTNSPWDSAIKPYAEAVIPEIRARANDAVIIVGTDTWSQDIGEPLKNPLPPATYGNVMYTFHFYANTHKDDFRTRVENAIKDGLPVFITEFGTCNASGDGGFNADESRKWFELCKKYSISHLNWSLCNKNETASAILQSCTKTSGWQESDLTESGKLVRSHFKNDCTQ